MTFRFRSFVRVTLLAGAVLIFNLPLVWTLLASFGVTPNNSTHPPQWMLPPTWDNYREVITPQTILKQLGVSTLVAVLVTLLTLFTSFLAAYALSRSQFRGRRLLLQGLLVLASLPVISYVIPLKDLMFVSHLYDTLPGVALAETALFAPLAVYALVGYLARVPTEIEEAARVEGATLRQVLHKIILPTAMPGMAATGIIIFVLSWNQLLMLLVITAHRVQTLTVMMSDFFTFERELEWGAAAAALVVSVLPVALLVAATHRLLEQFGIGGVNQ